MNTIELNRHQLKTATFGLYLNVKCAKKAFKIFQSNNVRKLPTYQCFARWFKEFKSGILRFKDDPRTGRPKTVVNSVNTSKIKDLVLQNRKSSIRKLAKMSGLNRESIRRMMIKNLRAKKLKPIKVPHKLTQVLKDERMKWCKEMLKKYPNTESMDAIVTGDETYLFFEQTHGASEWRFEDEDTPKMPRMMRYTTKKRMYYIFFNRRGLVHFSFRKQNKAATGLNYKLQLSKVVKKIRGNNSNIIIHDDNAPIHCSNVVSKFYTKSGVTRLPNPRYSPDLAPCDFWLIRKLKRSMDDKYHSGERKLYLESLKILKSIPAHEYARCFDVWREKMEECIKRKGEYVEYRTRDIKRKNK